MQEGVDMPQRGGQKKEEPEKNGKAKKMQICTERIPGSAKKGTRPRNSTEAGGGRGKKGSANGSNVTTQNLETALLVLLKIKWAEGRGFRWKEKRNWKRGMGRKVPGGKVLPKLITGQEALGRRRIGKKEEANVCKEVWGVKAL